MQTESSIVVVYLASPRAAAWRCWTRLDCLAASLALLKLHAPNWPVVVFHEDYSDDDKKRLTDIYENITFELVDFKGKEDVYENRRPDNRVGTYGYCMMCRFFCGQMQRHPAVKNYSHYMRLDDDSYIMSEITTEHIERILAHDYTYIATSQEPHCALWEHTGDFKQRKGLGRLLCGHEANVPYNNFHTASLALWKHPIVDEFLKELDSMNAYTSLGWPDASVHAMLIAELCPKLGLSVTEKNMFDYRHNQHCIHNGPHGKYCIDRFGGQYNWGPPACLEDKK